MSMQMIFLMLPYPAKFSNTSRSTGVEQKAIDELKRITKNDGLVIIATPNSEMLDEHGFSYDELQALCKNNFSNFCIFENAFIPAGDAKTLWEARSRRNEVKVHCFR